MKIFTHSALHRVENLQVSIDLECNIVFVLGSDRYSDYWKSRGYLHYLCFPCSDGLRIYTMTLPHFDLTKVVDLDPSG